MSLQAAVVIALAATITLVGCGAGDDDPAMDSRDAPDGDVSEDRGSDEDEASSDALLGEEVMAAIDDLADEQGVDPAAVEVRVTELVTWPDSALGCPEPDGMYTQALVDGYRIVLAAEGSEFFYHGEQGSAPFRCEDPQAPAPER